MIVLIFISTNSGKKFPFLHLFTHTYLLPFLWLPSLLEWDDRYLIVVLIHISLLISDANHVLVYLLLRNTYLAPLHIFLITYFLAFELLESFIYSVYNTFHSLSHFFCSSEPCLFNIIPFVKYFNFCFLWFSSHIKKYISQTGRGAQVVEYLLSNYKAEFHTQCHQNNNKKSLRLMSTSFSSVISSSSFIVSFLTI
jgi:hypothetical protein